MTYDHYRACIGEACEDEQVLRRQDRRRAITQAAIEALLAAPPEGMPVATLGRQLGVSTQALHHLLATSPRTFVVRSIERHAGPLVSVALHHDLDRRREPPTYRAAAYSQAAGQALARSRP